jgi:cytochrome c-type biogenesis protein CcmH/NrfG
LLSALVARDPHDLRANVLLAQCERRAGQGAAALARLEALSLEKASPADRAQGLKLLGQLRFDAEKYAAAVIDLRAALALSPRDAELHQALASALAATGDANGATEQRAAAQHLQAAQERLLQALRAVRKNPTDPEARFEQAVALNEAQSPAAAITALRALLADHPQHAAAQALYDELVNSRAAKEGL